MKRKLQDSKHTKDAPCQERDNIVTVGCNERIVIVLEHRTARNTAHVVRVDFTECLHARRARFFCDALPRAFSSTVLFPGNFILNRERSL